MNTSTSLRGLTREMNRHSLLAMAFCLAANCILQLAPTQAATRPNFVFLLADDLGWGDLYCQGHPYIQSPKLDRLAAEGSRFDQFYVGASVCHPSRSCFMSGRFNASGFGGVHQVAGAVPGTNGSGGQTKKGRKLQGDSEDGGRINVSLAPGVTTLPQLLKQAGYVTAHVGKWHLNTDALEDPSKYGLDFMQSGQRHDLGQFTADMQARNGQDQSLARAAVDFVKKHRHQPFYLQLWFTVPHSPVRPSEEELQFYENLQPRLDDVTGFTRDHFATRPDFAPQMRAWRAQITGHDRVVGEVLAALDELGLSEDTLVFYSSDNGPAPPSPTPGQYNEERNAMGSAGPWNGRKNSYYEGGSANCLDELLVEHGEPPGIHRRFVQGVVVGVGAIAPEVALQIVPQVLDRIKLRAVGRQLHQRDVPRHNQRPAGVEASPVPHHHRVLALGDHLRKKVWKSVDDLCVQLRA